MRRRFQKGSLQQVRRGKAKRWVVLYYNAAGKRQFHTLGAGNMSKTEAENKRDEFMRTINGVDAPKDDGTRPLMLGEFIEQTYLPFLQLLALTSPDHRVRLLATKSWLEFADKILDQDPATAEVDRERDGGRTALIEDLCELYRPAPGENRTPALDLEVVEDPPAGGREGLREGHSSDRSEMDYCGVEALSEGTEEPQW